MKKLKIILSVATVLVVTLLLVTGCSSANRGTVDSVETSEPTKTSISVQPSAPGETAINHAESTVPAEENTAPTDLEETAPSATEVSASECLSTVPAVTDTTQAIPPETQLSECIHRWETSYHAEEGHYGDLYVQCACGVRFANPDEWTTHHNSFPESDAFGEHGHWWSAQDWIVDTPEYYERVCSTCGEFTLIYP